MANNIRIRATLDDKVTGPLGKIRDQFDRLGKNKGAAAVLQGIGVAAGVNAYAMLGSAINGVVSGAKAAIDAASDLNETLSKTRVIFGDSAGDMEKWAATASQVFGQSKRQALDTAAEFANVFQNVGLETQANQAATTLTQLGSDLASFFNSDVQVALDAIKSGLAGQTMPLRQFGIFLNETAVNAEALRMGFQRVNGEFTDGQKTAARYALILKQTKNAQGDFARTADGFANSQRSLAAEVENLSAELGQSLLPIAQELALFLRDDVIPAARATGDALQWIGENADWLASAFGGAQGSAQRWADRAVEEAERVAAEYYKDAASWDTYSERAAAAGHLVGQTSSAMAADIRGVGKAGRDMATTLETSLQRVVDAAAGTRDRLQELGGNAASALYDPLIASAELAVTRTELADARRAASAKGLTQAEKQEADLRVLQLQKQLMEQEAAVKSYNGVTIDEIEKMTADYVAKWKTANGTARDQIGLTIRQLELMRLAALQAAGALNDGLRTSMGPRTIVNRDELGNERTTYIPGFSGKRAAGGPVDARRAYLVGEEGPELLVPNRAGRVIPNDQLGSGTTVIHTHVNLDGRQIAEIVDRHLAGSMRHIPSLARNAAAV